MSEENKAIMRRFYEDLFGSGDLSVADEIVATEFVNHNPPPGESPGREGIKEFVTLFRTAFPDIHYTVEDQIAEGDKVVTRFTMTGTHRGDFPGIPATGKPITVTAIGIHRLAGGKTQEAWFNSDLLGMMQQLGVIPPLG